MSDDIPAAPTDIPPGYAPLNWPSGFGRQIGPIYERAVGSGFSRAFQVAEHHANAFGHCHGGMLMSFADIAFGHAVTLARGPNWVTVRLMTDFISAARLGDWVEGLGEVTGEDGDLITVRGRIWCGERTIMTGAGVFKMIPEEP